MSHWPCPGPLACLLACPKQWNMGTLHRMVSSAVRPCAAVASSALLRMLWWLRPAALGEPVVPDVYCKGGDRVGEE